MGSIACDKCGGVGYGFIDAEIGHRGTDPCPACDARLEKMNEEEKKLAAKEKRDAKVFTRGPFLMKSGTAARSGPSPRQAPSREYVSGGPGPASETPFDVEGLVNTGKEVVTIDQALADTANE